MRDEEGQKSEVRSQKSEVREVGGRQSNVEAVSSQQSAVSSQQSAVSSQQSAVSPCSASCDQPPLANPIARDRVRATRSSIMIPWMTKRVFISRERGVAPEGSNWSRVIAETW